MEITYKNCNICPRGCRVDRESAVGVCRSGALPKISRVSRHMYEEPAICGERGAGTVFFSGCNLGCVFCQNSVISRRSLGKEFDEKELSKLFLTVAESGVSSLDLVTPTHFTPTVASALTRVKDKLTIPVVWNSSGYEGVESLGLLRGLVDIYLPDFKYYSPELSAKYSRAADYRERAEESLSFMYDMLGAAEFDDNGMMKKGIIVRHLVLPGQRTDSIACLRRLSEILPIKDIRLSLMSQYTPDFYTGDDKNLLRRVTTFEYESVRTEALLLGFEGYMQSPSSASSKYTPEFSDTFSIDLS
ncbi:MAG: 4Fe-4S cluster-binding domain-containing protein [Clostridia bacterium]|nr:4Fe-4S cluster-binding domain-containing protein [Clostridia bacterium]